MKRSSVLRVLNPILAVLFLNQILSGLFGGVLPPALFEVMHQGGGMLFAVVALVHVILNWNWVVATFFKRPASAGAGRGR